MSNRFQRPKEDRTRLRLLEIGECSGFLNTIASWSELNRCETNMLPSDLYTARGLFMKSTS